MGAEKTNGKVGTVYTYAVPESLRGEGSPKKVSLRPPTADQELMASKIGRLDFSKTQYAAVKIAIAEFDGRQVTPDGEVDIFWEKADPRLRSLLLQAYNKMTSPTVEDEKGFFNSEEIRVG